MQASAKRAAEFRVTPDTSSNRGGTLPPSMIAIETLALFGEWERDGYVEDFKTFKDNLRVVRDPNSRNRVNLNLSPNIANMLQTLAATFDFLL